jgi:stage II sporulation SpoAA-like protein
MIQRLDDMPPGTLGFLASGTITRGEYHEMIAPVLQTLERGQPVNLLFATAEDFSGLDLGALWEDLKTAGTVGLKHRSAWRRFAVVTDKDWMRHAIAGFGWLSPGELRVFPPDQLDAARDWVAG